LGTFAPGPPAEKAERVVERRKTGQWREGSEGASEGPVADRAARCGYLYP